MRQKWKPLQFVEISMHEIFAFQDKLDAVSDDTSKVWSVVDDFFAEAENQLELDPDFIKELTELNLDDTERICVKDIDDLFQKECGEDYNPSHIEVLKEYLEYKKRKSVK